MSNKDKNKDVVMVSPPIQLNACDIVEVDDFIIDEEYNVIGYALKSWCYTVEIEITWTQSEESLNYAINKQVYENNKTIMTGYLVSNTRNRPNKIKLLWSQVMNINSNEEPIKDETAFIEFS